MNIPNASPALYNEDLAPATERKWGAFSIFNVWTSDVHSLWGYYLAASLFLLCGSFVNFILAIGVGSLVIYFLMSLVGNACEAMESSEGLRELRISVSVHDQKACVRVEDSGPGIRSPECLFQPFQPGAEGTGLGLYVSRAVVRSYGGELRFEPSSRGSRFMVELQVI